MTGRSHRSSLLLCRGVVWSALCWAVVVGGCGPASDGAPAEGAVEVPREAPSTSSGSSGRRPPTDSGPTIVFLGDSLTAGYGLGEEQAFPALLERRLAAAGLPTRVVNAGVSGDTTAGGRSRLDWLLRQEPQALVLALGANDGLRALPLEQTEANLRAIVERAREGGAEVLLVGMRMPPNYGARFTRGYEEMFARVARDLDVRFEPFLLEGVAARPELNQADGIHPTAEGQEKIADHLAPAVIALRRALSP